VPKYDGQLAYAYCKRAQVFFFFFFTLVTGPRRSLSLELRDTRVYEPQICKRAQVLLAEEWTKAEDARSS